MEIVEHAISVRRRDKSVFEALPGRALVMASGMGEEAAGEPYEFHKLGGLPVFTREFDSNIGAATTQLMQDGFAHHVQLAFPVGPQDALLDCDWPFGDAVFHLFTRHSSGVLEYRYCWG